MKLTKKQLWFKENIQILRIVINDLQKLLGKWEYGHRHIIIKHRIGAGAYCAICDKSFGWYCANSPDHICHYFSKDGKITLIDGTNVQKPVDSPDKGHQSEDWCLYCGEPEERK